LRDLLTSSGYEMLEAADGGALHRRAKGSLEKLQRTIVACLAPR